MGRARVSQILNHALTSRDPGFRATTETKETSW